MVTNSYTEAITGGSSGTPDFGIDLRISSDDQYHSSDEVQFKLGDISGDSIYWEGTEAGDSVLIDLPGEFNDKTEVCKFTRQVVEQYILNAKTPIISVI